MHENLRETDNRGSRIIRNRLMEILLEWPKEVIFTQPANVNYKNRKIDGVMVLISRIILEGRVYKGSAGSGWLAGGGSSGPGLNQYGPKQRHHTVQRWWPGSLFTLVTFTRRPYTGHMFSLLISALEFLEGQGFKNGKPIFGVLHGRSLAPMLFLCLNVPYEERISIITLWDNVSRNRETSAPSLPVVSYCRSGNPALPMSASSWVPRRRLTALVKDDLAAPS
ncbi:hypothetical protein J6590_023891 [Homalodisca vitripennis]|nr:hypothetical protein J6590_023891 [Homalodisca vitripennis]